jgi:hypothetical protein
MLTHERERRKLVLRAELTWYARGRLHKPHKRTHTIEVGMRLALERHAAAAEGCSRPS